ncbi:alpha-N-acetylgalactosaminidase-like [Ornithodoros turicata]|uniref:alpha-N-acetylgalactosaminidase-like n=1 Tax=Ornithodoros turicata TaxID=34597 RepID=UPI003139A168
MLRRYAVLLLTFTNIRALENGLARTPPMGWLSWERFQCNVNCVRDPENCISERLFKEMAEIMVLEGYRDAGYVYVNIDDCWMSMERDSVGRLQADPERFPKGIKHMADFMHSRGLKLGIYEDVGTKTCAGYPGSMGHLVIDAQTFADWEIDMVKMDGCFANVRDLDRLYPSFNEAINRTGRPMVYSCSWPAYQVMFGITPDYKAMANHCNLWRNYMDISDSWATVLYTIDYYASLQNMLTASAGPGHWHDPDMLIIGNFGLSYDQSKAQMALWAIMAAPLLMSHDLRHTRPEHKEILLNKAVIAIDQDPLGKMGRKVYANGPIEIWTRPVTPVLSDGHHSYGIVFFNRRDVGNAEDVGVRLRFLGLRYPKGYRVTDLFENKLVGVHRPDDHIVVRVNPTGVVMLKAEPVMNVLPLKPAPADARLKNVIQVPHEPSPRRQGGALVR